MTGIVITLGGLGKTKNKLLTGNIYYGSGIVRYRAEFHFGLSVGYW